MAVLARLWVRRLSPYARARSFNRFLHKQLPPRRRISDGRRLVPRKRTRNLLFLLSSFTFTNGVSENRNFLRIVPAHWRTSTGDADRNPDFVEVWLDCFDAISPWTVGRYGNIADADRFAEEKIAGDVKLINERNKTVRSGRRLDYIPVVLPGGSGYNLSEGKWGLNGIPREGGRFLWRQIYNARRNGVRTIYGAMWDE